ncbi:MAG: hypothetical protein ACPGWR_08935 [Ardenticatenaceae bacterium]
MFINVLIVASLTYTGVKSYRKQRRAKEAARFGEYKEKAREARINQPESVIEERRSLREEEQKIKQDYTLATLSLGLSLSGALIYAPLSVLSAPLTIYTSISVFEQTWDSWYSEQIKKRKVIHSLLIIVPLYRERYVLPSFINWFYQINRRLFVRINQNLRQLSSYILKGAPRTVWVLANDMDVEIPFEQLKRGDTVIIYSGDIIPVDGIVSEGNAEVMQFTLSKQHQSVQKEAGDSVSAWTMVMSGHIYVRVEDIPNVQTYPLAVRF